MLYLSQVKWMRLHVLCHLKGPNIAFLKAGAFSSKMGATHEEKEIYNMKDNAFLHQNNEGKLGKDFSGKYFLQGKIFLSLNHPCQKSQT